MATTQNVGCHEVLIGQRLRDEQALASIERAMERRGNEADRLPVLPPWRDTVRGIAAACLDRPTRVGLRPPRVAGRLFQHTRVPNLMIKPGSWPGCASA